MISPCKGLLVRAGSSLPHTQEVHFSHGILVPFADCVRDRVQGEHPRRGAQSAAAQHGLQPKCPLPAALLCHTESFGLKGESLWGLKSTLSSTEGGRHCFFLCMGSLPQAIITLGSINFQAVWSALVFMGSTCISAFWMGCGFLLAGTEWEEAPAQWGARGTGGV